MRAGFFNEQTKTSHQVITVESLKGLKKKELKAKLVELSAKLAAAENDVKAANKATAKAEKEFVRMSAKNASLKVSASRAIAISMYVGNTPVLAWLSSNGYKWAPTSDGYIRVLFGQVTTGDTVTDYGLQFGDLNTEGKFKLIPYYGKTLVVIGDTEKIIVEGHNEFYATVTKYASRPASDYSGAAAVSEGSNIYDMLRRILGQ